MKKITKLIVCMLLVSTYFAVSPNNVSADLVDGDYTYYVQNDESIITGYIGTGGAITIPSMIGGHPTVAIVENAFKDMISLTSIILPNSLRIIGNRAFQGCSSLTTVTIPSGVTNIGNDVFDFCSSLAAINVNPANMNYASIDGVLYNKAKTSLIQCPMKKAGVFVIPKTVIIIEDHACYLCKNLTSVEIPESVITIGIRSFSGCSNLNEVIIPNKVININSLAFASCSGLTSVVIGNNVTNIGDSAFIYCTSLSAVTIPKSVTTIGKQAFKSCSSLTSINFLGLVAPTSVGDYWIDGTNRLLTGHAYATSNFPSPGNGWNGLMMGTLLISENELPNASFTWVPSNPTINNTILFNASASSDSDGSITKYAWDWNNDGIYEESLSSPTTSYSWTYPGNYSITLRVTDNDNATSIKTIIIPVFGEYNTDNIETPGFEFVFVLGAIVVTLVLLKKKNIQI